MAAAATVLSITAYAYFVSKGMALGYKDSISHLQIAARTLNSPTAGFAQLGGVWLPLPHVLMLPLVWFTPFYYSGFAGSAVSMIAYVVACVYVYKMALDLTRSRPAALAATAVFALNPNVLYMQSTPMTELLLFAAIVAMAYYIQRWIQVTDHERKYRYLFAAAVAAFIACLTRYEAWPLTLTMGAVVAVVTWRQYGRHAVAGMSLAFGFVAGAAIVLWMGWNQLIFGNALNFQNGQYAKPSLWVGEGEPSVGHPWVAAQTYWYAVVENLGIAVTLAMIVGAGCLLARRQLDSLPVLGLLVIAPFFVFALTVGQRPLHVMQINHDLYNVRFGLMLVVPAAILVGYLVSVLPARCWVAGAMVAAAWTLIPAESHGPAGVVTATEGSVGFPETADTTSAFLAEHYDGGVILIESFGNESILFKARIPLNNNVYEGSYQKWDPALSNPPGQQIRWIVTRSGNGADQTFTELQASHKLTAYREVFRNDLYIVYQFKD
ncbi:glycosyltransferase family 39 protein [Mycobacterium sp. ITM-2016-00317]|uniref:glycosyltransferase family 39 protein n=1 Tax=Mycobacterium sp. ITM-2016-00317 TaxID=2099694 RepID=UPI00287FAFE3|nr:glycosyltransferase family 39 protein [Mycobacterium sp. ITM-2016-00317]WNG86272.1 glycosyltransferase family 39 protein [Mycobacterium sp. ITM-2016-00317]